MDRDVTKCIIEALQEDDRDALVNQLSSLLPTLQQDPSPATRLIEILVRPSSYSFSKIAVIQPPVDFVAGLEIPSPPLNLVTLALLEKACNKPSDTGIIASKPEIVGALIKTWLCTPDTAVAQKASEVIYRFLICDLPYRSDSEEHDVMEVTYEKPLNSSGQGLMWRRIFGDKDIYGSIFSLCSLSTASQNGQLSKRDKTVAQARLLELLVKIADIEPVGSSQIREVEQAYGVKDGGLLEFAATRMVDYRDDVLMHMTLIDFYADYLGRSNVSMSLSYGASPASSGSIRSTNALDFLVKSGLHSRTMSFYLNPEKHDSLDLNYLYGRSANYVSVYCSQYPEHLLQTNPSIPTLISSRLLTVLGNTSSGQWSQGRAPIHDLHVLSSLPPVALLPQPAHPTPLFLLPVQPANAEAFSTLAHNFRGPSVSNHKSQVEKNPKLFGDNKAAARALYFLYLKQCPAFWKELISAAETVALTENALAAMKLMGAIISAEWAPLPADSSVNAPTSPYRLPSENELAVQCSSSEQQLPPSGVMAILTAPALEEVLPYLLQPAQTFSNLVGGRGDTQSSAYRVAVAKFDVLLQLHQKLKELAQVDELFNDVVATVGRRVAQGPMGGSTEVGGRVGTLEL